MNLLFIPVTEEDCVPILENISGLKEELILNFYSPETCSGDKVKNLDQYIKDSFWK
jgi:hypothetical protein